MPASMESGGGWEKVGGGGGGGAGHNNKAKAKTNKAKGSTAALQPKQPRLEDVCK